MLKIISSPQQNSLFDALFTRIKDDLDKDKSVVLVVPAQATLSMERKAFDALESEGFFNLHIIRGRKLHEIILNETSRPAETPINTIGRAMLLRKLASDRRDELKSFSTVLTEPGFIDMVGDFIVQLKQNNVDDERLSALIDTSKEGSLLQNKLSDMRILFNAYQGAMEGKFTDSEDLLSFVTERVKASEFVKNSCIYFYGFYSFTQRELLYLAELERCSKDFCIALLCGEDDYFAITRRTRAKLFSLMRGEEVIVPAAEKKEPELHVVRCAGPYTQAQTIAADIRRLVREKGYDYGDFAVLCDGSPPAQGMLKRVLSSAGIPVFLDEKRPLLHNSAIAAISSVMNAAAGDFKTSDIIKFCKSGILELPRDALEDFENYLKLYHIKGGKLHRSFKYGREKLGEETFAELEAVRQLVSSKTLSFSEKFNTARSVREKALALYNYLDSELNLRDYLVSLSESQAADGFPDASEESAQAWDVIIGLLEQIVELLGDEPITSEDFAKLLESGFADIKVGVLPQAEGRVQLGSVARSFSDGIKALYIAGFNDGKIPSDPEPGGILTEMELAALEQCGVAVSKNSDLIFDEENYMIHKAISGAEDYVWLGYCLSDDDGDDIKISPMLSDICETFAIAQEDDISSESGSLLSFEGRDLAMPHLADYMRSAMSGAEIPPLWKEVYNIVKDDAQVLKAGLRFNPKSGTLGKEKAGRLFAGSGEYSFSPSRMDGFAACPFKHFVNYGLRPQELRAFEISGSEIGSFHHEALLHLCNALSKPSREEGFAITDPRSLWMNVDDEELERMLNEAMCKAALSDELGGVMDSSAEALYRSERVRVVCLRFAKHMVDQVRHSVIDEMYVEAAFGRRAVFPPVEIMTPAGKVYVEGKIDRVDIQSKDGGKYVKIVDYKSGNIRFNKKLVETGLQLQLMVYLEGALGELPRETPGGIYYFNIADPSVEVGSDEISAEELTDELAEKINKEYKLSGMDVEEEFRENFMKTLSGLCERLVSGEIAAEPKQLGSVYDSCAFCEYSGICRKDIK